MLGLRASREMAQPGPYRGAPFNSDECKTISPITEEKRAALSARIDGIRNSPYDEDSEGRFMVQETKFCNEQTRK